MYLGGFWVDITGDVRNSSPVVWKRGRASTDVDDLTANTGTLSFVLDNSQANSGAKLGYYSYGHADCRAGFGPGALTRLSITYGGTTYYEFYGKILSCPALPGIYGDRSTSVTCVDYINEFSTHNLSGLDVQVNQRGDQLLTTIIGLMTTAPLHTSFATGLETFPYALHDCVDGKTSALNAVQRVNQSGLSYLYVQGNTTDGETLHWDSRHSIIGRASAATINTMLDLKTETSMDDIKNIIHVTSHPSEVGTSPEVVASLQGEITIQPGQTLDAITYRFRDPSGKKTTVAIVPDSGVAPVADTDYKMSKNSGDGGNNLNGDLSITVTWHGSTADVVFKNSGTAVGYINKFNLRALIIRNYDSAETISQDATSKTNYGDRDLNLDLPYQSDPNVAVDFADMVLDENKDPHSRLKSITFTANQDDTLMAAALTLDVNNVITITETQTGISADYLIGGIEGSIEYNKLTLELTALMPSQRGNWFQLDVTQLDDVYFLGV